MNQITSETRLITPADLADQIERLEHERRRYRRLWNYYQNPMLPGPGSGAGSAAKPYRQAQEWGLPPRITGMRTGIDWPTTESAGDCERKEVVIENDIAWRIDTMADYLFGKPIVIDSAAPDPDRRAMLSELIRAIFAANGGVQFLQQLALLGSVYGFVDVLVTLDPHAAADARPCATQALGTPPICGRMHDTHPDGAGPSDGSPAGDGQAIHPPAEPAPCATLASAHADVHDASEVAATGPSPDLDSLTDTGASTRSLEARSIERLARMIRFEMIEPARALPLLRPDDWRIIDVYAQVYDKPRPAESVGRRTGTRRESVWERLRRSMCRPCSGTTADSERVRVVDIITRNAWARYEDDRLVAHGCNALGRLPLVHIQNVAMPFQYAGGSDVEPLIPLQDELNTRLSDRASRITLQSFRMYIGKGIDNFIDQPIGPGRMWMTDNENAEVISFGGDVSAPSEDLHIADVREALDKTSGVTPIAAGAIKGRIGRLTSAAALRITLLSLLAKNDRKRTTYGAAIAQMAELALAWLDVAGVLHTSPEERRIEIHWPSPLPENTAEKLQEAESKLRLGIERKVVLRELGY